jgi:hypothetical protein
MTLREIGQRLAIIGIVCLIVFLPGCYLWKKAKKIVETPVNKPIIERYTHVP